MSKKEENDRATLFLNVKKKEAISGEKLIDEFGITESSFGSPIINNETYIIVYKDDGEIVIWDVDQFKEYNYALLSLWAEEDFEDFYSKQVNDFDFPSLINDGILKYLTDNDRFEEAAKFSKNLKIFNDKFES